MVALFNAVECVAGALVQSGFVIWVLYTVWKNYFFFWLGQPENIPVFRETLVVPIVDAIERLAGAKVEE
jgi:hypothetical protein